MYKNIYFYNISYKINYQLKKVDMVNFSKKHSCTTFPDSQTCLIDLPKCFPFLIEFFNIDLNNNINLFTSGILYAVF